MESHMPELQDPVAVINSLQARISHLEKQLQMERDAAQGYQKQIATDAVRRLRLHCVIPLYVGAQEFGNVLEDVHRASPSLVGAIGEAWLLSNAPVSESVKTALLAAANNGMSRW
jgi:hypothetical protein